ncbi:MAG: hypothetical protein LBD77_06120 [Bifidobacteriaceae bacterium]|jgi:predicted metal-dependent HD superfamily phosphohydrolase|nr:hypothetical protein [Bifidobacteriaceae bacterium]
MVPAETPQWLLAVWSRAVVEAGSPAPAAEIERMGAKVLERWANPSRHFHGMNHLIMVLEKIDELSQEASCPCLVRLAAFYHGAILSGGAGASAVNAWSEDHSLSADLAEGQLRHLELPAAKATRVRQLIADLGARPPLIKDPDLAVLCDAERAILAADPRTYRCYARDVRAECADAPLPEVLRARIAVLRAWLAKDRLFHTSGTAAWEQAARNNVEAELARSARELAGAETPPALTNTWLVHRPFVSAPPTADAGRNLASSGSHSAIPQH